MKDLNRLSRDARYCLSEITWAIDYWHQAPMGDTSDDPIRERLRGLSEFLIELIDNCEFDVQHVAYELRIDPETGNRRNLSALLRSTDEEIEKAGVEATLREEEDSTGDGDLPGTGAEA
jgi:hypothetical protein